MNSNKVTIQQSITTFIQNLSIGQYSKATISARQEALRMFVDYCCQNKYFYLQDVKPKCIENYAVFVHKRKSPEGKLLSLSRKKSLLIAIKLFFRWLFQNDQLLINPATDLTIPKLENRLPRNILSVEEIESIGNVIDLSTNYGQRDRAILELFYSTGIRRSELSQVKIRDLDFNRGTLYVRHGKGNKQRIVPIGKRAIKYISQYLHDARSSLLKERFDEDYLFVTNRNNNICNGYLCMLISDYRKKAGIEKEGSCHMLRHSMATHMHKNSADIKHIKDILGHERISTTEIYTRVDICDLKEVYEKTHPSARAPLQGLP